SSESKTRSQPRRAFCAGAFLMDFSRDTVFRLYSEVSYPGPYPLRAPWLPPPSDRNVTNAPENIVRTKRGKIVTHYTIPPVKLPVLALLACVRRIRQSSWGRALENF